MANENYEDDILTFWDSRELISGFKDRVESIRDNKYGRTSHKRSIMGAEILPFFDILAVPLSPTREIMARTGEYDKLLADVLNGIKPLTGKNVKSSPRGSKLCRVLLAWMSHYHAHEAKKFCNSVNEKLHSSSEFSESIKIKFRRFDPTGSDIPELPQKELSSRDHVDKNEKKTKADSIQSSALNDTIPAALIDGTQKLINEAGSKHFSVSVGTELPLTTVETSKEKNPRFRSFFVLFLLGIFSVIGFVTYYLNTHSEAKDSKTQTVYNDLENEPIKVWQTIPDKIWINGHVKDFREYAKQADERALLSAALQGDAEALALASVGHHLGILSQWDHGLEIREFSEKGCSNGAGLACLLLADHYTSGDVIPQNLTKALVLYEKGCDLNFSMACQRAGVRLLSSDGVRTDIQRGYNLLEKACSNGHSYTCYVLGFSHVRRDVNAPRNAVLARKYYEKACGLGFKESCDEMKLSERDILMRGQKLDMLLTP